MNVAVLGASPKPDRYAHKAILRLLEHGHAVVPVHPTYRSIEGLAVVPNLDALPEKSVDTVTVYVRAELSQGLAPSFLRLRPRRVIFNPGTENPELEKSLRATGIHVEEACTLVLLDTGQFDR